MRHRAPCQAGVSVVHAKVPFPHPLRSRTSRDRENPMASSNGQTTRGGGKPASNGEELEAPEPGSTNLDIRQLLRVLTAVKKGDFSVRMPEDRTGTAGKVSDALNDIVELNERMASEFARLGSAVGKEGRINQR